MFHEKVQVGLQTRGPSTNNQNSGAVTSNHIANGPATGVRLLTFSGCWSRFKKEDVMNAFEIITFWVFVIIVTLLAIGFIVLARRD